MGLPGSPRRPGTIRGLIAAIYGYIYDFRVQNVLVLSFFGPIFRLEVIPVGFGAVRSEYKNLGRGGGGDITHFGKIFVFGAQRHIGRFLVGFFALV